MEIHPKIEKFIGLIKKYGFTEFNDGNAKVLAILKDNGASQTEATISFHQGFGVLL